MEQISLGGRPMIGLGESCPECDAYHPIGGFALGETLACPECSCSSYLLGGALLGAGAVFLTFVTVGGYVFKGRR